MNKNTYYEFALASVTLSPPPYSTQGALDKWSSFFEKKKWLQKGEKRSPEAHWRGGGEGKGGTKSRHVNSPLYKTHSSIVEDTVNEDLVINPFVESVAKALCFFKKITSITCFFNFLCGIFRILGFRYKWTHCVC